MSLASAFGDLWLESRSADFGIFSLGFGLFGGKVIKPWIGAASLACEEIPFHCFDGIKCHAAAGGKKFGNAVLHDEGPCVLAMLSDPAVARELGVASTIFYC